MGSTPSKYNKEGKHYASASRIMGMTNKILGTFDNLPSFILNDIAAMGHAVDKLLSLLIDHDVLIRDAGNSSNDKKLNKMLDKFIKFLYDKTVKGKMKLWDYERYVKNEERLLNGYIDLYIENSKGEFEIVEVKTRNLITNPDPLLSDKLQLLFYLQINPDKEWEKGQKPKGRLWYIDRNAKTEVKEYKYTLSELEKEVGHLLTIALIYYNAFIRPEYDPKLITKEK